MKKNKWCYLGDHTTLEPGDLWVAAAYSLRLVPGQHDLIDQQKLLLSLSRFLCLCCNAELFVFGDL